MRLELTPDEAEVRRHLLQLRLTEIRKEIAQTATRDFRDELKSEELLVERLRKEMPAPVRD